MQLTVELTAYNRHQITFELMERKRMEIYQIDIIDFIQACLLMLASETDA